jgi:hypothetical protein
MDSQDTANSMAEPASGHGESVSNKIIRMIIKKDLFVDAITSRYVRSTFSLHSTILDAILVRITRSLRKKIAVYERINEPARQANMTRHEFARDERIAMEVDDDTLNHSWLDPITIRK